MSKTFKSAKSGIKLSVCNTPEGLLHLKIGTVSIQLDPTDAPALMLALGEAAGWPNEYLATTEILRRLRELDEHAKAVEAEAKEQAELEAEALELFNTLQTEIHGNLGPNWVNVTEFPNIETKRKWLVVARKAREMRAEK